MIEELLKGNDEMLADVLAKQVMVMGVEDVKSIGLPIKYGE